MLYLADKIVLLPICLPQVLSLVTSASRLTDGENASARPGSSTLAVASRLADKPHGSNSVLSSIDLVSLVPAVVVGATCKLHGALGTLSTWRKGRVPQDQA